MEYLVHLGIIIGIYAILGVSLNLVVGFAGLLSVTHAAFYGVGAYALAILMLQCGWGFFPAAIAGMGLAGILGLLIGVASSKFKGDYYALVSFGFNIIVWSVMLNWQELTRGPLGIPGIPAPSVFGHEIGSNEGFLIFSFFAALVAYLICDFIAQSSFGRALKGIREDEDALRVFGYDTSTYKLAVFASSAAIAAFAGSLYASYISFIDPSSFTLNESIFILATIIVGGLASLEGSIVGAAFLVLLPEALRFVGFTPDVAAQMRQVAYGLILVILMLYRPQGFMGKYRM